MPDRERSLFISDAWGGENEDIVNVIDKTLQKRGISRFGYLSTSVQNSSQIQFDS